MSYSLNQNRCRRLLIATAVGLLTLLLQANKAKLEGAVRATLHIEPDDTPRAGKPVLVWFALTRSNGKDLPLADCNCQLAVLAQSQADPIMTPTLRSVSAEGYENIPGAEITFPTVGTYELVLTGTPARDKNFAPFELNFPVTVIVGQAPMPEALIPTVDLPDTHQTEVATIETDPSSTVVIESTPIKLRSHIPLVIGIGLILAIVGVGLTILRHK